MDTYREHPSDFDPPSSPEVSASEDVAAAIGTDERRMHVRAYNYWVSLLDGRDFPSIEDLDPANVEDFAGHSVLLDFTCGRDNPAVPYIGAAIRDECGLSDDTRTIDDVPSRSLLSRLTDHYLQIIANRAPIGFEAEFANQRDETICYRGILMPFSSDGDSIDFIYGVINWKLVGDEQSGPADMPRVEFQPDDPFEEGEEPFDLREEDSVLELGENESILDLTENESALDRSESEPVLDLTETVPADADAPTPVEQEPAAEATTSPAEALADSDIPAVHFSWEDGPLADTEAGELPEIALDENAGLADRLWAARETADAVKAGEGRTRAALYRALSLAYDFAIAAEENADEYTELLEESGVKAQARAPMTPIVKLVFGIDYDKARLTEFAAALSYARREEVAVGGFQDLIEKQPGGLKALVSAERAARRPQAKADTKGDVARARLRTASPISLAEIPSDQEFAVVLTRRRADGRHEPVAIVDDEALVERVIRRTA